MTAQNAPGATKPSETGSRATKTANAPPAAPGAVSDAVTGTARAVKLRDPFPAPMVGTMPKGGVQLAYVGHGAVTDRLLAVDPGWNWEPLAYAADGLPLFDRDDRGNPIGLWIKLTVNGISRLGYGDCPSNQGSPEKVLIGDALRNAAMRFGVALDLWIKGHGGDEVGDGPRNRPQSASRTITERRVTKPTAGDEKRKPWEQIAAKYGMPQGRLLRDARNLAVSTNVKEPNVVEEITQELLEGLVEIYEQALKDEPPL